MVLRRLQKDISAAPDCEYPAHLTKCVFVPQHKHLMEPNCSVPQKAEDPLCCAAVCRHTMLLSIAVFSLLLCPSRSSRLCSHLCQCYEHSDLVDCHAKGFENVPHGLPHGTWLLDLGGNRLTEIRSRAFAGLWSLRILVLSDSNIQALQSQVTKTHSVSFLTVLTRSKLCFFT